MVTGASSGIGEDIAKRLNQLGATVIASGRNEERLNGLKQSAQFPDNIRLEAADLTENISGLPEWIKSLRVKYGKLKGLICSAGLSLNDPLKVVDEKLSKNMFEINYWCPIFLAKGFADKRNNVGQGSSILFISSVAALRGGKSQTIYAGSKAALIASAQIISRELAPVTRVNCISPALVDTGMAKNFLAMVGEELLDVYPLGIGLPSDISALAAFLVSDEARWITGQNYILDGGI